jgi:hypothetical protein
MRRLLVLAVCGALLSAGCGGDDDTTSTDASTTSTPTDGDDAEGGDEISGGEEILGEDEYTDVLAASFEDPDTGFGGTADEARCAAEAIVDAIGADRMQEAGVTEEVLTADENAGSDLTEEEATAVADAVIECVDLAAAYARGFAGELASADDTACVAERFDDDIYRQLIVADIMLGGEATLPREVADVLADTFVSCADLASTIVESVVGSLDAVTDEQIACVEAAVQANEELRDVLAESYATGVEADDQRIGLTLIEDVIACVPEAAQPGE